jgi:DNA-binding transcriptional LysR family regulator
MDIEALQDFLATIAAGSISAGARVRGQPKQTVSRRIRALEAELNVRLIDRSTRALALTPEGALLNERASRIVEDLEETKRALLDRAHAPVGLLRISAPMLLGQTLLGNVAAQYLSQYPSAKIEIILSDTRVDLVADGFDAAIRIGAFDDTSLVSRLFARAQTLVVASPSSLIRYGTPSTPSDLTKLPCICFGSRANSDAWQLQRGSERKSVDVNAVALVSSLKLALDMCISGSGFTTLPAFLAIDGIEKGELVRVLPDWNLGQAELRIVFPSRRLMSARLRAFIDILVSAFSDQRM